MLDAKIRFKKNWRDNKGVSEIVGTILMLAITVVLFSSIMVFVTNMPMPVQRPTADFLSSFDISTDPPVLTLTHNGGEPLSDYNTVILVVIDGTSKVGYYATGTSEARWSIGNSWTFYDFHDYGPNTSLEAMVIDMKSNSQVWAGKISASSGNNAPIILQRWADADTSTLTPDPIRESDTGFTVYVRAIDPDVPPDLPDAGVWLNASSVSESPHMAGTTSGGVWAFTFSGIAEGAASSYDGKPLFIHAMDTAGHETVETFLLDVQQPDISQTYNTYNNTGTDLGDSGLPLWLKYVNEDQGYVILGEDESKRVDGRSWGVKADVNDPKTSFTAGEEWVFIRVGSLRLKSIQGINNLSVVSRLSGQEVIPPSNSSGFYKINELGNAFIYEAKFNSSLLSPGGYDVIIDLQSTGLEGESPTRFYAKSNLSIYPQSGQESVFIPSIEIFDKDRRTDLSAQQWGTFEDPYDLSVASQSIVWVEVHMQSISAGAAGASIYEVRVADMRGRTNLFGDVPSGSMISALGADLVNGVYYFKIDLKLRNGITWTSGLSAYSLTLTRCMDNDEGVYTISMPMFIRSALHTKNFVIATTGFGSSGNANFDHFDYLYQVENNKFFTTKVLEAKDETPGAGGDASKIIKRILYFDMDEDGDRDVLAGMYDGAQWRLVMYTNRLNVIGAWEVGTTLASYGATAVLSLAYGDIDADGDYDWAVCLANGAVYLYINDYPIETTTPFVSGVNPRYFTEMRLVDVTGDGKADLIGIGSAIALANRGAAGSRLYIYDFWVNDVFTIPPSDLVNYPNAGNIYDFDIADINLANGPDIAVCSAATVGIGGVNYGIRWYERDVTYSTALATNDPAPGTFIGNVTAGSSYTDTQTSNDVYESITEYAGDLEYIWPVGVVSGKTPTLYLEAKVSGGSDEGFYVYYSRDVVPRTWTFMFALSSTATTDTIYSFPLPSNVAGTIYVKVVDASTSGSHDDTISVDHLFVSGISMVRYDTKPHGLAADINYIRIGIGNFNGIGNLDVAVGKGSAGVGGSFKVIDGSTGLQIANLAYVDLSPGGDVVGDPNGDAFKVADVNGDGLADVVSAVYSTTLPDVSILRMWLNLGDGTTYSDIQIIDCSLHTGTGGKPNGDDRNIYSIAVEDPYG